ncbi:ribonuclease III [Microvirga guangxiensis]|uniref:Ribonuclease 3 n=1 Tax=Microvirga guangxiensis TaxID=549386 RepID=A0A1G5J8X4_9HYPH|nr:ribonuclease III [Microvirga guangxiensis]SCY84816.1 ribonuclease-3 [Microvirga guangxiensis]
MARRKPNYDELLKRLDYQFRKPELLDEALTHVSAPKSSGKSYQRLEFLGDRVLGLAIAETLYKTFPSAPEGELSRRLAELVRRESCAEIAVVWDVGPFLKLGAGEAHSGERRNPTILADVCEAIIGAVFLDGGYEAAKDLVERSFKAMIEAPRRALRDPKSALQEWAQGRGLPPPTYTIAEQTGPDHAPKFRVMVKVKGAETEFGHGTSKRIAEQAAARSLLLREGVWTEEEHGTV